MPPTKGGGMEINMKIILQKENINEVGTVVCIFLFYLFSVIGIRLWVKGNQLSDSLQWISYIFLGIGIIIAIVMLGTDFKRTRVVRPLVVVAISVCVIIKTASMWDSGKQVGGYFQILDKGYSHGEYYLVLDSDQSLPIICDKDTYHLVNKNGEYTLDYRVIGSDKKTAYLMELNTNEK